MRAIKSKCSAAILCRRQRIALHEVCSRTIRVKTNLDRLQRIGFNGVSGGIDGRIVPVKRTRVVTATVGFVANQPIPLNRGDQNLLILFACRMNILLSGVRGEAYLVHMFLSRIEITKFNAAVRCAGESPYVVRVYLEDQFTLTECIPSVT